MPASSAALSRLKVRTRLPIQLQRDILVRIHPAEVDYRTHSLGQPSRCLVVVQVTADEAVNRLLGGIVGEDYGVVGAEGVGKVLCETMGSGGQQ